MGKKENKIEFWEKRKKTILIIHRISDTKFLKINPLLESMISA
jgi:hypothetical protein